MRPFSSYSSDPLYKAVQSVITEKVTIAPEGGWGKEVPANIKKTLQTILDSVVDKEKKIKNAKFFDSGYTGVSFEIGPKKYTIVMASTRMGRDDIVRGYLTLAQNGNATPLLNIKGPDSLNATFPTMGDLGKMVRAVSDLL